LEKKANIVRESPLPKGVVVNHTDSGGAIPAFIKNTGSQIGIRKLFAAIRKQVRDPKYAKGLAQKD
jgi:hypothetical protein